MRSLTLVLVVLALTPASTEARPCSSNQNVPPQMMEMIQNMRIGWDDGAGTLGINQLFTKGDGAGCMLCHGDVPQEYQATVPANDAVGRFQHCANCHDPAQAAIAYPQARIPDWLTFTQSWRLKRNSYYYPGHSKAEGALRRALEGSMPPGAQANSNNPHLGKAVSWCDEITAKMQAWIDAGSPQ